MIEFDLDFIFFSSGIFFSLPLFWLILGQRRGLDESSTSKRVSVMVVLGSGGHTTEMVRLSSALNEDVYRPRVYVIAETDLRSEEKLRLSMPGFIKKHYKTVNE